MYMMVLGILSAEATNLRKNKGETQQEEKKGKKKSEVYDVINVLVLQLFSKDRKKKKQEVGAVLKQA